MFHLYSAAYCHDQFRPELRADIGYELRKNTVACHPVLKQDVGYCDGVGFLVGITFLSFVKLTTITTTDWLACLLFGKRNNMSIPMY